MKNKPFPFYPIDPYDSFAKLITLTQNKYPDKIIFRTKRRKNIESVTYTQFCNDVQKLSYYFNKTYGSRNTIAVIGENSYEWLLTYFAVVCSNNIIVPIDKDLSASDITQLLQECNCQTLVCSNEYGDIAENISDIIPNLTNIMQADLRRIISSIDLAVWIDTDVNAPAAIIYTSGTTGKSKGVMLSQKNICEDTRAACSSVELYGRTISILPFHHTFAFSSTMANIYYGVDTLIPTSLKNITQLMLDFKPTYVSLVPLIVEQIDKSISQKIDKSGKKNLLSILDKICRIFDVFGIGLRQKCFSAIRNGVGGQLDIIVLGGASIDFQIIERFNTYGIQILNGYGITECSPFVCINRRYHNRTGSIGLELPGIKVKIDHPNEHGEGEICVRGENVMLGYFNNLDETASVMYDGWFHTGDLGKIDNDGFIYITGRIKNLIILSNGKNVSPEELETLISRTPGVNECLVFEKNNKLETEIYPDKNFFEVNSDIHAYFIQQISKLNTTLPPYKEISNVTIRDTEFEKTTTKKIKRFHT